MLAIDGGLGLLVFGLWLYAIFDVISTDEALVRNLPKTMWIFLVIILFDVGAIAWLLLGRPKYAGWQPGDTSYRPRSRPLGPEDRQDFGTGFHADSLDHSKMSYVVREREEAARLKVWEAQLKRREEELRAKELGVAPPPPADTGDAPAG